MPNNITRCYSPEDPHSHGSDSTSQCAVFLHTMFLSSRGILLARNYRSWVIVWWWLWPQVALMSRRVILHRPLAPPTGTTGKPPMTSTRSDNKRHSRAIYWREIQLRRNSGGSKTVCRLQILWTAIALGNFTLNWVMKLPVFLIKYHSINTYGGVEV
jgi:hypothetical protein